MSLPDQADIPQQMSAASAAWTKLRRMSAYASFDGWSLTIVGMLSLASGGYKTVPELLISIFLIGAGVFEISAVRQLRRLNPSSISKLFYNQIVLAGALILYAITGLIISHNSTGLMPDELQQTLAESGMSPEDAGLMMSSAYTILYATLIAFALLVQGGTAVFYRSRKKYLDRYIEQTPAWIQQMQRDRGEVSL